VRWALAIVIGLFAGGCGGGDEPTARATATPTATATPEGRFEIAYKLPRNVAQRLHKGNAYELIHEEGEVIAWSDFGEETSYPLTDWLRKRGIEVEDPGELTPMWLSVYKKQHLYLLIMTTDDQVADALDELELNERRLAAVYNRWSSQKRVPGAGDAMVDWLRIFRLAVREGDQRNLVIIPIL
jgi:hypothetical protein